MVTPETRALIFSLVNYWLLLSDNVCSSSLAQQQKGDAGQNKKHSPVARKCREQGSCNSTQPVWWSTHSCRPLNRLCVASDCASDSPLRPTKRLRVSSGAPASGRASGRPAATTKHTQRETPTARGAATEPQENHSGTQSSHLKFTDRAGSGARTRETQNVTPCTFVCASAKSVAACMIKSDRGRFVIT